MHSMTQSAMLASFETGGINLNQTHNERDGYHGTLPASAPLANPFVPFQQENPPQYDAKTGIIRGTLYPGLDLPFMGMINKKQLPETPMAELQTLAFALHELALYLDTHRNDKEALQLYKQYQMIYHEGMMKYGEAYGPMNHMQPSAAPGYAWLDDPWPWEYQGN